MTRSETVLDATVRRQVEIELYANGLVNDLVGILNGFDDELFGRLAAGLESLPPEQFTVGRVEAILAPVFAVNDSAFAAVQAALSQALEAFAASESNWNERTAREADENSPLVPIVWGAVLAAALGNPVQGRTPAEWVAQAQSARAEAIRVAVRNGYVGSQPFATILRTIRGTASAQFGDGLFARTRTSLETIFRTVLTYVSESISAAYYEANHPFLNRLVWLSVLDSRTSETCRLRSGKLYAADTHEPLGHAYPWGQGPGAIHMNCRSSFAPVFAGEPVPRMPTYDEWLRRQSAATQDNILGPTRGARYRAGTETVAQFANNRGRWLRIDEL